MSTLAEHISTKRSYITILIVTLILDTIFRCRLLRLRNLVITNQVFAFVFLIISTAEVFCEDWHL